jgi:hypothetical protein
MTTEELRQQTEVKDAINRLKTRFPDPDDIPTDQDMGIWVNPESGSVFTSETNDPIRGCVLVYSVIDGEL